MVLDKLPDRAMAMTARHCVSSSPWARTSIHRRHSKMSPPEPPCSTIMSAMLRAGDPRGSSGPDGPRRRVIPGRGALRGRARMGVRGSPRSGSGSCLTRCGVTSCPPAVRHEADRTEACVRLWCGPLYPPRTPQRMGETPPAGERVGLLGQLARAAPTGTRAGRLPMPAALSQSLHRSGLSGRSRHPARGRRHERAQQPKIRLPALPRPPNRSTGRLAKQQEAKRRAR